MLIPLSGTQQGATVTYLLRKTYVFDEDAQVQPYIKSGKARLVSGDGLKAEDVAKAWQAALDAGNGKIEYVVFSIGAYCSLHISDLGILTNRFIV